MPATAEPPSAPSTQSVAQAAAQGAAQPPIVSSQITQPVEPITAPKPGSARARLNEALRKRAKPSPTASDTPQPGEPPKEAVPTSSPPASPSEKPAEAKPPETPTPTPTPQPEKPAGKDKPNPWKLVDDYKGRLSQAEARIAELTKGAPPAEELKSAQSRIAELTKRAEELENEIRFVNYSQSEEFKTKYQKPYESAWQAAMHELSELTVDDGSGNQRQVSTQDLLMLVNLPLGKAREQANALFGDFADDVMAHRKEIRSLYDAQAAALEEAKKNGATRDKERQEKFQAFHTELTAQVKKIWESANESALNDEQIGRFFKPIEGDQDGNQRLAKGFELVDRAFGENPLDPKLTPEQRASVVRRHSAVRNRAAAFGRLVAQVKGLETKNAELLKELEQFKQSTPPTTGGKIEPAEPAAPGSRWEKTREALRQRAH